MSRHRAGVLLLGAQSCLPVPGVPAVGGVGSVLLSMARMGWKLCHVFRPYAVVMYTSDQSITYSNSRALGYGQAEQCTQEWIIQNITTGLPSPRLHSWLVTPPLLGVYIFTAGLPSSPLTGVFAYMAIGHTAVDGHLRLHHRLAFVAVDWWLCLLGWLVTPPSMGDIVFTAGLPPPPPMLCSLSQQAYYAAVQGRLRFRHHSASSIADCCYTAIDWITDIVIFVNILSSLFNIAYSTAIDGQLRHYSRSSLLLLIIITVGGW
uniref:HGWP repeat containing protein-like n=1 Tax=Oryza sativa subsp. japonica TaxID=39947 RepID=Q9AUN2_ORYSJ|nr:Hypothetical protein [Oryza sativa Japonica Group]